MSIKGIIFDLDGVLVTTDEFHYLGWKRLAEDEGIPFSRDDNHRQRGVSRMESLAVLLEKATRSYTEAEKLEMATRKNNYYVAFLQRLTPQDALPGARALLEQLRARDIKLAIGSSSRNTPQIIEKVGLTEYFDAVADGNDISRSKPDPEVFLLAAERLGLKPEECVVVEDAEAGVQAARRAGMRVFAIGPRERHPDVASRSDDVRELSLADLLAAGE